jgi:hypothetical protein
VFNKELLEKCLDGYTARLAAVSLPIDEAALEAEDVAARGAALEAFSASLLGRQARARMHGQKDTREHASLATGRAGSLVVACAAQRQREGCSCPACEGERGEIPCPWAHERA